jgi:N-acetylglucosamine-6-phosphate deacetylase
MKKSEICARHYASHQVERWRWRDGRITHRDVLSAREEAPWWIAPGLFDWQINGFGAVDFQSDGLGEEALLQATRALRRAGCTRYFLTLITDEWDRLIARLGHLRAVRARCLELQAAIAGWHVEGPFLSAEAGYHGAHNPALMLDPTPAHLHALRAVTGTDPVLVTLAPERQGALESIAEATALGLQVSLGHTNAGMEALAQAATAGARGFTHLGNACPQQLDRHDNILWRVLETRGLTVSLIPDKIHVSPLLFRLIHRVLPLESLIYTADAMAAAGAPPGRYSLGALTLEVGPDRVVRVPGQSNFAGSALRPIDGVFNVAEMLGLQWQDVWNGFSVGPAEWLGLSCALGVGHRADFCLVRTTPGGRLAELRVFFGGEEVE